MLQVHLLCSNSAKHAMPSLCPERQYILYHPLITLTIETTRSTVRHLNQNCCLQLSLLGMEGMFRSCLTPLYYSHSRLLYGCLLNPIPWPKHVFVLGGESNPVVQASLVGGHKLSQEYYFINQPTIPNIWEKRSCQSNHQSANYWKNTWCYGTIPGFDA